MSNGILSSAEKRGAGKEASTWVWVGMEIGEASAMEMVVKWSGVECLLILWLIYIYIYIGEASAMECLLKEAFTASFTF